MTSSLQEQLGVAMPGARWDVQGIRLWQSTDPDIVLYAATEPALSKGSDNGRYQAAVSQFRRWQEDTNAYKTTGGSALLTVTVTPEYDPQTMQQLRDRWRMVLMNKGYSGNPNPRFVPLPMRNMQIQAAVDPGMGKLPASNGNSGPGASTVSQGGTSGTASLMLELTESGADSWAAGITGKGSLAGSVKATYEYPQMLPQIEVKVTLRGQRVFGYLSTALKRADDGTLYGSSDDIARAWDAMVRSGDIYVRLAGTLPPEAEAKRDELLHTCAEQARQQMFDTLFTPMPAPTSQTDATNGATGTGSGTGTGGPAGSGTGTNNTVGATQEPGQGALYALRWQGRADAQDAETTVQYEGWNWLQATIEAPFSSLLTLLDASYLNVIYTEVAVPVSMVVSPDPVVSGVAASLIFSEGHVPEAPVFNAGGGTVQYILNSMHPDTIMVNYKAKVSFSPMRWPVLEVSGSAPVSKGGNHIMLKPSEWVHSHTIYMYVRDGDKIKTAAQPAGDDYLVVNVSYQSADKKQIVKESTRITPQAPVRFSYPVDPADPGGEAKLSAFGVVGGQSVRAQELVINRDEESVFILASSNSIQLVSKSAVLPEDDGLAQRLLQAGARPTVTVKGTNGHGAGVVAVEEDTQSVSIDYELELIPQPTDVTCWAASLAMVISNRDQASYSPQTVAEEAGMDITTGYGWSSIQKAVRYWGLKEEGPRSAIPQEWERMLQAYGPLWIVEVGAPYHAVVVSGIEGDGTTEGTWVTLYNPWPPNVGAIDYKWFIDFDQEFGLGAGSSAMIVHA